MSVSLPSPSSRLLRAASAEQADLERHRERLAEKRTGLLAELRELEEALAATDHRLEVLAQLVGPADPVGGERSEFGRPGAPGSPAEAPDHGERDAARPVLRGPGIREQAVRVLVAQRDGIEALHYRRWYELLLDAGYRVNGKDPLAVFLTQLSRSPVVRKAAAPGVYELDRQAPVRLRQRLERLQAELREVTLSQRAPVDLASVRARRHELDLEISQQERALDEALRVLHPAAGAAGAAPPPRQTARR